LTAQPLPRQFALAWGAVALAGAALVPWLGPRTAALPACPLHVATGWPCPACGSGRALAALADGDLAGALGWNPLAVAAFVAFGAAGVLALAAELAGRPLREPRTLPGWMRVALPLAVVADWLYLTWALR
jgi:hypothetical protein